MGLMVVLLRLSIVFMAAEIMGASAPRQRL
jgi:hypothetical protein